MTRKSADSSNRERIWQVDYKDKEIGPIAYNVAHREGIRHRAVHVFFFRDDSYQELDIVLRSRRKLLSPLLWHSTVSGHVNYGEQYKDAAYRETREEMFHNQDELPVGFHLEEICSFHNDWRDHNGRNKENVRLFRTVYDGLVDYDRAEIETKMFRPVEDIRRDMLDRNLRRRYSPDFKNAFEAYVAH